jgi:aryl-alcohol dehydrogenase-like predicted oxidoreductase
MRYRMLGRTSGLRVSEAALGTGKFGGPVEPGTAAEVLGVYAEAGGRFIDTAAGYQGGQSERIVGRFLAGRRDEFVVGTKWAVGMMRDEPFTVRGTSRKAMVRSVDESLRRLGTDYVDLLWTHGYDDKVPVEEIMLGFDRLVTAGKIRYGGLGTHPAWKAARAATVAELRGWAPMAAITTEYGPSERDAERELLPAAEAMGFGVLAWSPLGGGFLARYGQAGGGPSSHLPHWFRHGRPAAKDLAVHAAVRETAAQAGESSAAVGYAWLLDRARHAATGLIPVIGASTPDQLRQDLRAIGLQLSPGQLARIDQAGAPGLGEPHVHNLDSDPLQEAGPFYRPAVPVA